MARGSMPAKEDAELEALEAELIQSRSEPWTVETFLVERHRAKIDALERPQSRWSARLALGKELANGVFIFVGQVTLIVLAGVALFSA